MVKRISEKVLECSLCIKLFIDGSSPREKCYPSAYCIFKEKKLIYQKVLEVNLPAQDVEYLALIMALLLVEEKLFKRRKVKIFSDCMYMILELEEKKKPDNPILYEKAKNLLEETKTELKWIPREQNRAGIYLEKRLSRLKKDREFVSNPLNNPEIIRKEKREKLNRIFKR